MKTETKTQSGPRTPNAIDKRVGANIRERRLELAMTMQQLSEKIGISNQQLQKYETGTNRLSAGLLPFVAAALDVDIPDLFRDDEPAEPLPIGRADRLRNQCIAILRRTRSDEVLDAMHKVLKAMAV